MTRDEVIEYLGFCGVWTKTATGIWCEYYGVAQLTNILDKLESLNQPFEVIIQVLPNDLNRLLVRC